MILLISIVAMAVLSRLLPHPWNWTAVGAASLFAGAKLEKASWALLVPLLTLFVTDLLLGFHATMPFVYLSFAVIALAGWVLRRRLEGRAVAVASVMASLFFYFVSNFGVWLSTPLYTKDLSGLMLAYGAGLPFLGNQMVGDLFYAGVLFGGWALVESFFPGLTRSEASLGQ